MTPPARQDISSSTESGSPGSGSPGSGSARAGQALVAGQVLLLAAIAALPRRTNWPVTTPLRRTGRLAVAAGAGIATAAATTLGRGLTALPAPNQHARLRTGGLYRWVRHPIYSGVLLAAAGRAAASGNRWTLTAWAALLLLHTVKTGLEERQLTVRFPDHPRYAARTPRLFPTRFPSRLRPQRGRPGRPTDDHQGRR